jgi:hypothetical protein
MQPPDLLDIQAFLDTAKRRQRRGKLHPHAQTIQALRERGASYGRIADYLLKAYGLKVTVQSIADHIAKQSKAPNRPASDEASAPLSQPRNLAASARIFTQEPPAEPQYDQHKPATRTIGQSTANAPRPVALIARKYDVSNPDYQARLAERREAAKPSGLPADTTDLSKTKD